MRAAAAYGAAERAEMEVLRISRDAYGREVLEGMSWDLIWVFFGLGWR